MIKVFEDVIQSSLEYLGAFLRPTCITIHS